MSQYRSITDRIGIFLFIAVLFIPDKVSGNEPIWPINFAKYISSSFGEPRTGRFHLGIDCKSGGTIGKEVYAVGDGYISRVITSPYGYGKAIYITLDTGKTVIYGHLYQFAPKLEEKVYALREKKGSYDIDWWLQKDEIRVTAGQVIAWSGDSGSGGQPHLHFEIRDANNNPLNPFNEGFVVTDTVAPQIGNVVLIPLDAKSSVNGLPVAQWVNGKNNQFYLSGRIGVGALIIDKVDGSSNELGAYEVSLKVDGENIFSKRYDAISYEYNKNGRFDYLTGSYFDGSGTVSALFSQEGITLPFYEGDGIIEVLPETTPVQRTLTITARDYAGNVSIKTVPVILGERPYFIYCGFEKTNGSIRVEGGYRDGLIHSIELYSRTKQNEWRLVHEYPVEGTRCNMTIQPPKKQSEWQVVLVGKNHARSLPVVLTMNSQTAHHQKTRQLNVQTRLLHDQVIVEIKTDQLVSTIPQMEVTENSISRKVTRCMIPKDETSWIDTLPFVNTGAVDYRITVTALDSWGERINGEKEVCYTWLDLFRKSSITSDDSLMTVFIPLGSLYQSAPVFLTTTKSRPVNGLTPLSKWYQLTFGDQWIKGSFLAQITATNEIPEHTAIFYQSGTNRWTFLSGEMSNKVMTANLSSAVCIGIFQDRVAPTVILREPSMEVAVKNDKPNICVAVSDAGAGFGGSDSIRMKLDGQPIYGELNTQTGIVTYRPLKSIAPGIHSVDVKVTDRCGNSTSKNWQFTIASE
jgi:hypothetical protein